MPDVNMSSIGPAVKSITAITSFSFLLVFGAIFIGDSAGASLKRSMKGIFVDSFVGANKHRRNSVCFLFV